MKSREDFLQFVYDKAAVESARLKKQKQKNTGILLCSFAFLLICSVLVYPNLRVFHVADRTAAAFDTESFEAVRETVAGSTLDDSFSLDSAAPQVAPSYSLFASKAVANDTCREEALFDAEVTGPYTVCDYFTRVPSVYGYTVDYTDTEIRITVYTDLLPSEVGSYYFELPVWLDDAKQKTLPVKTEFVLK